ncbi:HNH endonuclease [Aurantimonas sp. C2-6-R+9]|uniref:HNH endonuclease n=1 Tax=unclassified Aurantimonas TaxID=2638230 RepID=UPI002E193214|nr:MULTISPECIES: HNH endonuclease [unclassified Aurantimonas]MEC5292013.1 HNH endonuclease [Aurantimonas sp. C2-3-R2]MEC5382165.1 HNH endonuclease [Aurantimonas sp. C2-6-R+9]MEC5413099.1 HNH endonuclease [Aurantimonas sp. C2-4-R8]
MAFGIFIHRSDSIYDDSPAERYQFPSQYLSRVRASLGDWIIYYEPRKVLDTRGYFAIAKVQDVISDPKATGMYVALIEPGSYLDFPNPVPFSDAKGVIERGVLNEEGRISGRAQSAVRPISPQDFDRILERGFEVGSDILPRIDARNQAGFDDEQTPFLYEYEQERDRIRIRYIGSRITRDRMFRRLILRAYGARCAITGLKLINGGGRAEVEAAHIRPVESNGPDSVNNGVALSGTVHWMFDRGLLGIADDLKILVSRQVNDPSSVRAMINESGYLLPPHRFADRPHPRFLSWHRENCFKH